MCDLDLAKGPITAEIVLWYLPGIHKIIAVLDKAESCYLHGFLGLSRSLKGEADVAAKTTTALSILVNSCAVLSTSPIKVCLIINMVCIATAAIFAITIAMVTCQY